MVVKSVQNTEHGFIHRFRMLLSLSVFLFVIGVLSTGLLLNLLHLQDKEDHFRKEQMIFSKHYTAVFDQFLQASNAAFRFSVSFNTDDLQQYSELAAVHLHQNSALLAFEDFMTLPGLAQSFGDFNSAYREVADIQLHAFALILHAFEVPDPVMPRVMRDYRLVSDELKWDNAKKVKKARALLFGEDTRYLTEQVGGNLKRMDQAAIQYYNDASRTLRDKMNNRLIMLIVLMLAMVLSVVVSLRLKMTQFDVRARSQTLRR